MFAGRRPELAHDPPARSEAKAVGADDAHGARRLHADELIGPQAMSTKDRVRRS